MSDILNRIKKMRGVPDAIGQSEFIRQEKLVEVSKIEQWFESYDCKIAEAQRLARMGLTCQHNIIELDIEAENKRLRLKTLKTELEGK